MCRARPLRCRRGSSRASISGEITASPVAAARTAEVSSSRLRVLETKPEAPASIAATSTWSAALAVSTTTWALGRSRRQLADGGDPVAVRQPVVEQDDVRGGA